jgi:hypothetical protein
MRWSGQPALPHFVHSPFFVCRWVRVGAQVVCGQASQLRTPARYSACCRTVIWLTAVMPATAPLMTPPPRCHPALMHCVSAAGWKPWSVPETYEVCVICKHGSSSSSSSSSSHSVGGSVQQQELNRPSASTQWCCRHITQLHIVSPSCIWLVSRDPSRRQVFSPSATQWKGVGGAHHPLTVDSMSLVHSSMQL